MYSVLGNNNDDPEPPVSEPVLPEEPENTKNDTDVKPIVKDQSCYIYYYERYFDSDCDP